MALSSHDAAQQCSDPVRAPSIARTRPEPSLVRALREGRISNREAARTLGVEESAVRQGKISILDGRFASLPAQVRLRYLELEADRLREERERTPVSSAPTLMLAAICASKAGAACHLVLVAVADGVETEDELRDEHRAFAEARKAAETGERACAHRLNQAIEKRKAAGLK